MGTVLLQGKSALSDFRIAALTESIRKQDNSLDVSEITARYVYLINVDGELSSDVTEKSLALLSAVGEFKQGQGILVTPRKGTISPWSSKATDIFHNCGLDDVIRVERGIYYELVTESGAVLSLDDLKGVVAILHDRMTEGVYVDVHDLFDHMKPAEMVTVDVLSGGHEALEKANVDIGLALSDDEIDYLYESYKAIERNPTDVELVMFGQVNSEHCRHKIFNAQWAVDGEKQDKTLFGMIRNTHEKNPEGTLVAYSDNSGAVEGFEDEWFEVQRDAGNIYRYYSGQVDIIMKVETHNHPTAISPYPGAATGVGGEIRDEAATGTGSKTKAGLCGFMVSNLRVPDFVMPWEKPCTEFPSRLATPMEIMTEGPIGGAGFGNEFGRPQLCGIFKTYEEEYNGRNRGYHKPIMIAGGMGVIKRAHAFKKNIPEKSLIVQLGGPAMKIGLGGGAASSMATGSNAEELDFNSVQRDNAEMQRRCQEVIDACISLGEDNPILSIHDIGAGGLSNGCPELVEETGGKFHLRSIKNEDISMSPMEIWCCEAQERYVLAIAPDSLDGFLEMCERERCLVAVIGEATDNKHLLLEDDHFKNNPIDIDLGIILGKAPKMFRDVEHRKEKHAALDTSEIEISEAVERVLHLPAVANKTFLVTITDRSITGMVTRDQMVGPYQLPLADVAVTSISLNSYVGEAMAMGERTSSAIISAPASGRMAIGEALTNIAASAIGKIGNIKLSANWMCACGEEGEDALLYDTVKAVGMELCPALGICIPVGKDSLSMRTVWETSSGKSEKQVAPLSLIISAFSPVSDVRKTITPDLKRVRSSLYLIDLGVGKNRMGCSALAQVYNQLGDDCADLDDPALFLRFFDAIQELVEKELICAYHDRSDGGLITTLCEMAIGGGYGVDVDVTSLGTDVLSCLFSEELGAVIQVEDEHVDAVDSIIKKFELESVAHLLGRKKMPGDDEQLSNIDVLHNGEQVFSESVSAVRRKWSELTYRMQAIRDNPQCALEEYDNILDESDQGMNFKLTFDPCEEFNIGGRSPRMAIFREQGINGQVEMAAAFDRAGFECCDVHMTDLLSGRVDLDGFAGLVACGGFSYGDVLGAGSGWAKSILYNEKLKNMFASFFEREDSFALGVCNGCQMISQLKEIIPGAEDWPRFTRNRSEQFEARYVTVEITPSPSIFFSEMEGSHLGIPVAHGEGFADFSSEGDMENMIKNKLVSARYIDNYSAPTERYPFNPNGSPLGITGLTTKSGRVTIMMPHPERVFRAVQMSYQPRFMFEGEEGPWLKMFQSARIFVS